MAVANTGSENLAMESAITVFLNRPITKIVNPDAKFSLLNRKEFGFENCGIMSL